MAVALYARVSTTRQADNDLSIPDQLKQMRDWCQREGWDVVKEYIEPGASATDDKRPVFQQMMMDATLSPAPYEAIVIHSQSRFFRDAVDFGMYERRLNRAGVKLISITQPNGDDSSSGLIRRMISVFDEYSSKENSKHTLRAMKENARQGYFNGSRAPYGYQAVAAGAMGHRGRQKKRLMIDESEAEIVKQIFMLYRDGIDGQRLGIKQITQYLNDRRITMRDNPWRIQKVHDVLSDTVYIGQYIFNRLDPKSKSIKPESEWIRTTVPAIVEEALFAQVQALRESRAPGQTTPRILNSPVLLTGLIRCGSCGKAMTTATGKGGRYRYYKCTSKMAIDRCYCATPNLPMETTDQKVIEALADQVFTPQRVRLMMQSLRARMRKVETEEDLNLKTFNAELQGIEQRIDKLYEALEIGIIPMDSTFQIRTQKLKTQREELLMKIGGMKRRKTLPLEQINPGSIAAFSKVLKQRLLDKSPDNHFRKQYLQLLVNEIRVDKTAATITGDHASVAEAIVQMKMGTALVPTSISNWCPRHESNV